jgi:amino acid adenylation domain-containing protein
MTLQSRLIKAFNEYASNRALEVGGENLSYSDVYNLAKRIAEGIIQADEPSPFVALMTYRSIFAYTGLLGTLLSGKAYLPLNPKFPASRTVSMLADADCNVIIFGPECTEALELFLETYDRASRALKILYLSEAKSSILGVSERFKQHDFIEISSSAKAEEVLLPKASADDYAYLLFTSGSTGQPKGISITQANVCAYMDFILSRYHYRSSDRVSQCFDFTFDPSVHDIFSAWFTGACLCTVPYKSLMAPSNFIKKSELSVWYSVPSVPMFMEKLNMLKEGLFPGLRYSMFSGEALAQSIAEKWQNAAPNSLVVNYYGPTEATVNITYYDWDKQKSPGLCRNGGVPLGFSFPEQEIRIVDSEGHEVPIGQRGELIVSGSQVARGYINNPEKTASSFRELPDSRGKIWYFTGDLVERDSEGIIYFYGRKDFQVQIRGYRVELSEVEGLIRETASTEFVAAVPWPLNPLTSCAEELVVVIAGQHEVSLVERIFNVCKSTLPSYMVPSTVLFVKEFPLSANGKIDRKALTEYIKTLKGEPRNE